MGFKESLFNAFYTIEFYIDARDFQIRLYTKDMETTDLLFRPRARAPHFSGISWRPCHWAIGRRGLASMSLQCRSSVPVELQPRMTWPMGSDVPIRS